MTQDRHPLFPQNVSRKDKDKLTRTRIYLGWVEKHNLDWREPNLEKFRDFLLNEMGYKPASVAASVSSIKSLYRQMLKTNIEQFSNTELESIRAAIDTHAGQPEYNRGVEVKHLVHDQIEILLVLPDMDTKMGLRDTTIMALILFTGISETEICELKVEDLLWEEEGLYLLVGEREVLVSDTMFYDESWVGTYVKHWLMAANIAEGALFRGFYRGDTIRKNKLHPNAIHELLRRYLEDAPFKFTVLDLRRTYARRLFDNDVPIDTIRENLGYGSKQTVINYIGLPDLKGELGSYLRGNGQWMLDRLK
jgi:integrase